MKRLSRYLLTFVVAVFAGVFSSARKYPNNLYTDSVNPEADKAYLKEMKARLDRVRRTEHRPTVALVLCGGGAKGAAEVGALKVLEELDIPVDIICGTSIGGLIGGLYSVGYRAADLDSLFRTQDWSKTLSDKIDNSLMSLHAKRYRSRYQLIVPFHYSKNAVPSTVKYNDDDGHLRLGNSQSLVRSLPAGYVYGLNVNNLFSSLTVGYQDSVSFAKLPIPFTCTATELVSCKTMNWGSGVLKTAMRTTMSIPGLFSPIRIGDSVMMDGGLRDNFPSDLAKAAGADIIIGIDLTDKYATSSQINNAGKMFIQIMDMVSRESYEDALEDVDVWIKPDLDGYNSISFSPEAVDTMIIRGYRAAMENVDELELIKKKMYGAGLSEPERKAVNLNHQSVRVASVSFKGIRDNDAKLLKNRIKINGGERVDAKSLEKAVFMIQASGAVESVSYSLLGQQEPFDLVFNCAPAPVHQLGLNVRMDSEVWAEVGINFGLNTKKLSGPKLDISAKIGYSQMLDARFILDYPKIPSINAEFSIYNNNMEAYSMVPTMSNQTFESGYWGHSEKIFLSSQNWTEFDVSGGLKNSFYRLDERRIYSEILAPGQEQRSGDYLGVFAKADYNSLNGKYYPTKGASVRLGLDCDFLKVNVPNFKPITTVAFDVKGVIPMGGRVALIPDFHLRHIFGSSHELYNYGSYGNKNANPEFSVYHHNFIGGSIAGRYHENQVPFNGMTDILNCNKGDSYYDHLAVLNLDLRVNVMKDMYVSALGGYARMAENLPNMLTADKNWNLFGAGMEFGYNTIVGPIKLRVQWCNRTTVPKYDVGYYLSIGFDL